MSICIWGESCRDGNGDTTVTLDSGKTVSLGFCHVANETSETISNITKCHIEELAKVAVEDDPESFIQSTAKSLLQAAPLLEAAPRL